MPEFTHENLFDWQLCQNCALFALSDGESPDDEPPDGQNDDEKWSRAGLSAEFRDSEHVFVSAGDLDCQVSGAEHGREPHGADDGYFSRDECDGCGAIAGERVTLYSAKQADWPGIIAALQTEAELERRENLADEIGVDVADVEKAHGILEMTGEMEAAAAVYWWLADWHEGQWDATYAALSTLPYRPGPLERSPGGSAGCQWAYDGLDRPVALALAYLIENGG